MGALPDCPGRQEAMDLSGMVPGPHQLTQYGGDQSHMTAEFRRVMGTPPAAFIAGAYPPPRPAAARAP
jgi:hypothetical protein